MHYALDGRYPIETKQQVEIASEYFTKYASRFNHAEKVVIAHRLEKRASDLGVSIDKDWVRNYSRPMKKHAGYSPDFERNMKVRVDLCSGKDIKIGDLDAKAALSSMIEKKASIDPAIMLEAINEFDKMAGLTSGYGRNLQDPVITVYGGATNSRYDTDQVSGDSKLPLGAFV